MTDDLYLSRARLRRDAPAAALRALLVPTGDSARVAAGHRLVWTLFADGPDRERDFLWRETEPGVFYLLSRRLPEDRHGLFEVDEPRLFAPALTAGDRLTFALRANATVSRPQAKGERGRPCDIVMDALHGVKSGDRAAVRRGLLAPAAFRWLTAQGVRSGFTIPGMARDSAAAEASGDVGTPEMEERLPIRVLAYRTMRVEHGGPAARIGVLDLEGLLEVSDPATFLSSLARGFGRAKAFGCGLMLVRRA